GVVVEELTRERGVTRLGEVDGPGDGRLPVAVEVPVGAVLVEGGRLRDARGQQEVLRIGEVAGLEARDELPGHVMVEEPGVVVRGGELRLAALHDQVVDGPGLVGVVKGGARVGQVVRVGQGEVGQRDGRRGGQAAVPVGRHVAVRGGQRRRAGRQDRGGGQGDAGAEVIDGRDVVVLAGRAGGHRVEGGAGETDQVQPGAAGVKGDGRRAVVGDQDLRVDKHGGDAADGLVVGEVLDGNGGRTGSETGGQGGEVAAVLGPLHGLRGPR